MTNEEVIKINKNGWNELIKSKKKFSNTILPEYGPFLKRNEDEINLMGNVRDKKVLDLGCGEGEPLEYLFQKGASIIYGLDISEEQIIKAKKRFPEFTNNFLVSAMEEKTNIPNNYFDLAISIFSIGYTSDLYKTFKNVYEYLNESGNFIISWTHPFYYCLDMDDNRVIINKSYFDEEGETITKGPDKVVLAQKNLMISTFINVARKVGFYVDTMLEEETILKEDVNGYKSTFWRKEKAEKCPSTIIFKFKKLPVNVKGE